MSALKIAPICVYSKYLYSCLLHRMVLVHHLLKHQLLFLRICLLSFCRWCFFFFLNSHPFYRVSFFSHVNAFMWVFINVRTTPTTCSCFNFLPVVLSYQYVVTMISYARQTWIYCTAYRRCVVQWHTHSHGIDYFRLRLYLDLDPLSLAPTLCVKCTRRCGRMRVDESIFFLSSRDHIVHFSSASVASDDQ